MSTRKQDRSQTTHYCIQLGGERPLPLGCTVTSVPWEDRYYLTATLRNQAVNILFKQEFRWQETSCPALSLKKKNTQGREVGILRSCCIQHMLTLNKVQT